MIKPNKITDEEAEEYQELWVQRVIGERIKEDGTIVKYAKWEKAKGDVSLGSINNPKNTDIIAFEYRDFTPINLNNPFGLFRRRGL